MGGDSGLRGCTNDTEGSGSRDHPTKPVCASLGVPRLARTRLGVTVPTPRELRISSEDATLPDSSIQGFFPSAWPVSITGQTTRHYPIGPSSPVRFHPKTL